MALEPMAEIVLHPIGVVHSPLSGAEEAGDTEGTIEIYRQYRDGLADLEGFSHLFVLFYFDRARRSALLVKPLLDEAYRGVFATRAPDRPNPIGLSVVCLLRIEEGILHVRNLDILDETPVLDIKPYIPEVDVWEVTTIGWLEDRVKRMRESEAEADGEGG